MESIVRVNGRVLVTNDAGVVIGQYREETPLVPIGRYSLTDSGLFKNRILEDGYKMDRSGRPA